MDYVQNKRGSSMLDSQPPWNKEKKKKPVSVAKLALDMLPTDKVKIPYTDMKPKIN